jgi:hypothetical protein
MWLPFLRGARVFTPPLTEVRTDRASLRRVLGYRDSEVPEVVSTLIDEILQDLPSRVKIRCGFRILPPRSVSISRDSFSCSSIDFSSGSIIAEQLRKADTLALFTATIGGKLEEWSKKLIEEGDALRGYIVDAVASEAVEGAAEWLEKKIELHVQQRSWRITNRYSPGYCGWSVAEQHKLFSLLPKGFCGVSLTASALMIPIKSISGIIGLGPDVKRGAYQCSICDLKDCFRRLDEPVAALDES